LGPLQLDGSCSTARLVLCRARVLSSLGGYQDRPRGQAGRGSWQTTPFGRFKRDCPRLTRGRTASATLTSQQDPPHRAAGALDPGQHQPSRPCRRSRRGACTRGCPRISMSPRALCVSEIIRSLPQRSHRMRRNQEGNARSARRGLPRPMAAGCCRS
jgi:hypothetical protein